MPHAVALEQESSITHGLRSHARQLEEYYLNTRFPNRYSPPSVPACHYGPNEAKHAAATAEGIFARMKELVKGSSENN